MLELKQLYEEHKRALNPQQGLHSKHGRSVLDNASEEEKINPSEDNDDGNLSGDQPRTKRRKNTPLKIAEQSNHSSNNDPTSVGQLQVTIRNILENHGGSCHLETIVENVKMRWQREGITKPEGTPYGHADCKKSVLSNFRARVNNKFLFVKDRVNEGCWTLLSVDDEIKMLEGKLQPKGKYLFQAIAEAIEDHSGCCYLEDIYAFVKQNWQTMSDNQLSDPELERQILITLSTNPKFMEDAENPDFYMLSSRKKRKKEVYDSEGQIPKNGNSNKKKKGSEESEEDDQPRRSRRRAREGEPPIGYMCRCGATDPGQGHKWKRGPTGDFICNNCFTKWTTKLCCPVCGKMYKKQSESDSEGEAPVVNEQDNSWIRCDDCHRWVMTKCDNIDDADLETFDDSNPNHLHYSCPVCRGDKVGPLGNKADGSKRTSMVIKTRSAAAGTSGKSTDSNRKAENGNAHKKGHNNNEESDSEEDIIIPDGKLEHVQKEIMDKIELGYDADSVEDEDMKSKLYTSYEHFLDDIQQYAVQLVGLRDREKYKGQIDLDRQIKRLREEKQRIDERLELEFVQDLKNYYRKQKKEYDRAKERITKPGSQVLKDDKL